VIVQLWEWVRTRDQQGCSAGVCESRERAVAALAAALADSGRPGRGTVGPVGLVNGVHSGAHYLRLPVTDIAVFEQGRLWWEQPWQRGARRGWSVVVKRGGQALCGV
jgi:hypothetical protein